MNIAVEHYRYFHDTLFQTEPSATQLKVRCKITPLPKPSPHTYTSWVMVYTLPGVILHWPGLWIIWAELELANPAY